MLNQSTYLELTTKIGDYIINKDKVRVLGSVKEKKKHREAGIVSWGQKLAAILSLLQLDFDNLSSLKKCVLILGEREIDWRMRTALYRIISSIYTPCNATVPTLPEFSQPVERSGTTV